MTAPQFDTSLFAQGLVADRLKLFDRLERMSIHESQALSLGVIAGKGHRIRFLNEVVNGSSRDIASEIRRATVAKDFDGALKIVIEQIKKGDVIFEKHSKGPDKSVEACANHDVLERLRSKELTLQDKKSGEVIEYQSIAEMDAEQFHEIQAIADKIMPEVPEKKKSAHATAQHTAHTEKEALLPAVDTLTAEKEKIHSAEPSTQHTKKAEVRETLKALEKAHIAEDRKEEKQAEEQAKAAEIQNAEVQKSELKRAIIKEEVKDVEVKKETLAHTTEHAVEEHPAVTPEAAEAVTPMDVDLDAPLSNQEASKEENQKEVP